MPRKRPPSKQCAGISTVLETDSSRGLSLVTYRKAVKQQCKRFTADPSGLCGLHRKRLAQDSERKSA